MRTLSLSVLLLSLVFATPTPALDLAAFVPVLRAADISAPEFDACGCKSSQPNCTTANQWSTGWPAINLVGATSGGQGDEWLTCYRPVGPPTLFSGTMTVDTDLCISRNNGTKGGGATVFYNPVTGRGLYLGIHDGGSSDRYTLGIMKPGLNGNNKLDEVKTLKIQNTLDIHAGSDDVERTGVHHIDPRWYRLTATYTVTGGDALAIVAKIYDRDTCPLCPMDLTSPLGSQLGPTFSWSGSLAALGLSDTGEACLGGFAITSTQATSFGNITITQ